MSGLTTTLKSWRPATLKELVFFQRGFDITKSEQNPGDIPVISSSGINSYHSEYMAVGPGVIIGRKGSLGTVHYSDCNYWPHDTTLWSKDLNGNNPRYVFYFLQTLKLEKFNVGNSNPTLNRNHIHNLQILIPQLTTQVKIADILNNYDNLIRNNHRRIQLLEQSSRLLYKEWFINLRFPGHEQVKVVDGIPEGWSREPISSLLDSSIGGGWGGDESTSIYTEPGYVIRGTDIPDLKNGNFSRIPFRYHEIENARKRILRDGDLILETSNGNIRNIGRSYRIDLQILNCFDERVISASFCKLLRPKNESLSHMVTSHLDEIQDSGRMDYYKSPSAAGINNFRFLALINEELLLLPERELIERFVNLVSTIRKQITNLVVMNKKTGEARDLLLPRLMNGEIAV